MANPESKGDKMRTDVYERITARIVSDLEKGVRTWLAPWSIEHAAGRITRPLRANGVPYQGINVIELWAAATIMGHAAPIWMTFKQAQELGGHVRKAVPLSKKERQQLRKLECRYNALCDKYPDGDMPDEVAAKLARVETATQALAKEVYRPRDLKLAGAFVTLGQDGSLRIERGYIRAEDDPKSKRKPKANAKENGDGAPALSEKLPGRSSLGLGSLLGRDRCRSCLIGSGLGSDFGLLRLFSRLLRSGGRIGCGRHSGLKDGGPPLLQRPEPVGPVKIQYPSLLSREHDEIDDQDDDHKGSEHDVERTRGRTPHRRAQADERNHHDKQAEERLDPAVGKPVGKPGRYRNRQPACEDLPELDAARRPCGARVALRLHAGRCQE
jgi:hypothetical protein